MSARAIQFSTPDDREELARAEIYGLLAQLFYAPPDRALHGQLQVAPTVAPSPGGFLESNWTELVGAAHRLTLDEVAAEHAGHLLGGLEEELIAGVAQPLRVVDRLPGADTEQDVVRVRVGFAHVVHVVGADERQSQVARDTR